MSVHSMVIANQSSSAAAQRPTVRGGTGTATSPNTPVGISSPEPITSPPTVQTPFPAAAGNGTATKQPYAGHTPFPGKAVSAATALQGRPAKTTHKAVQFAGQTPRAKAQQPQRQQQSMAGHTPHPKAQQKQSSAGHTPHPKAHQQQQSSAGPTPHPRASAQEVPSTNRRQKLAQMHEADSCERRWIWNFVNACLRKGIPG